MSAGGGWALGSAPSASGQIRSRPEDFRVHERLAHAPEGEGEHLWIRLRKTGANTEWVARALARWAAVGAGAVGYAGMKDRHAVTEQWFSIHLPGRADPDPAGLDIPGVECLEVRRHRRKLQRGALAGNRFVVTVRRLAGDPAAVGARLEQLAALGVPNRFGQQRFGREDGNLDAARALFAGRLGRVDRHQRGLYLSAARAALFNAVLDARLADGSWCRGLDGDLMMLDGSHSVFPAPVLDEALQARLAAGDIHPTGPLWGAGGPRSQGAMLALEEAVAEEMADLRDGLLAAGMEAARRALRVRLRDASWRALPDAAMELTFELPAGAYATVVLQEVLEISDPTRTP